ncbi:MAG TPA: hypothetical protein VFZ53_01335, partial [Polyangiaceae bacterium]
MSPTFRELVRAVVFVLPLACSENGAGDPAAGGGKAGGGSGGGASGMGTGGSSGSGAGAAGLGGQAAGGSAGSAGAAGQTGDGRSFVPDDLPNTEVNGEGGLTLTAFTLVAGATGPEFYAAVRNDGETPA